MAISKEIAEQIEFYQTYLPRVDKGIDVSTIQNDYNDGVVNGNILEFKLDITDLNATLFQAIKYLSAMRVKGRFIPKNILLVSLNTHKVYVYHSENYLKHIEKVYIGGASKDNAGFSEKEQVCVLDYSVDTDEEKMIELLRSKEYIRIHIDENCIVGWAMTYYNMFPNAPKSSFIGEKTGKVKIIGEIRKPDKLKDYIYPYEKDSNEKFRYLMDKLNDFLQKKNLGAFYTPKPYSEKVLELVRKAIGRVPEGNDYVLIDRCAGTGNLERDMTDDELGHVIVSTLEYYEYKVLCEVLGDKVRHIIPPTEKEDTFNMGMVRGADALSEEYIENDIIMQYVNNPKVTIILIENPPYAETTSLEHQRSGKAKSSSIWKQSYVAKEMKKEIKGATLNDLGNTFIWSAFKYYLRQPTDSYVVFSPVKYWKSQHLIDKEFLGGFAFNRKHFHTNIDACIMVALWGNNGAVNEELELEGYDINKDGTLSEAASLPVKKVHSLFSEKYYTDPDFKNMKEDGILVGLNGLDITTAATTPKIRIKPLYSDEMLGYLVADSVGFDNPDAKSSLLVAGRYNGNGFFLHRENFLDKLPMFAASRYITYNRAWTERARIMKSGDGSERFFKDVKSGKLQAFLLKCLLFTTLEPQNHMRTFKGSDNREYVNQLCLDETNGETIASAMLKVMKRNEKEKKLFLQWESVLTAAKKTKNYNPSINYGIYQIRAELNTSHKDEMTGKEVPDYPELNGHIRTLAELVKDYFNAEIVPVLFEYEFLK